MTSPFTPSGIPPGAELAGSPFSPGSIPTQSAATSVGLTAAGVLSWTNPLVMAGYPLSYVAATSGSAAWPTGSLAILLPFSLPAALQARRILWHNGSSVSGNVDAGVYNEDGTLVVAVGGVAQSGVSVAQSAALSAPTIIGPGSYFLALVIDNTTGTAWRIAPNAAVLRGVGVQQASAAYPLPASLTLAAPANAMAPAISLGFTTVL